MKLLSLRSSVREAFRSSGLHSSAHAAHTYIYPMLWPLSSLVCYNYQFSIEQQKESLMDTRQKLASRSYDDFQPSFEWNQEEGSTTLVISLPGFKKEEIKVQMDNFGNLRISGERPLTSDRWLRFRKDFYIPQNTNTSDIRAKFENGNLYVILPKLFRSQPQDQTIKAQAPESKWKTTTEPELREGQDHTSQKTSPLPSSKSGGVVPKQPNGTSVQKGLHEEQHPNAKEHESSKKTMEAEPRQGQNHMSQKDSSLSSSKLDDAATKQPNGKSQEKDELVDARITARSIQEKIKEQIHKPEDKKSTSVVRDKDTVLSNSKKRKNEVENETFHDGRSWINTKLGGLGMNFKKPQQLMLNVGVAIVILAGLSVYMSYKLRKSIEADNN